MQGKLIHFNKHLMEKYIERNKDLHMVSSTWRRYMIVQQTRPFGKHLKLEMYKGDRTRLFVICNAHLQLVSEYMLAKRSLSHHKVGYIIDWLLAHTSLLSLWTKFLVRFEGVSCCIFFPMTFVGDKDQDIRGVEMEYPWCNFSENFRKQKYVVYT